MLLKVNGLSKQWVLDQRLPGGTFLRLQDQHFGNEYLDLRINSLFKLDLAFLNVVFQILQILSYPRSTSVEHFKENDAQTPYVTLVREVFICKDLGSSIERSTQKGQFLRLVWVLYHSAEAEVTELGNSLLEEYVGGFDVAMDNTLIEESGIPMHQMPHECQRLSF